MKGVVFLLSQTGRILFIGEKIESYIGYSQVGISYVQVHLGESAHKKIGAISQLGAEKITFPPKPDGHTDRQTDVHLRL